MSTGAGGQYGSQGHKDGGWVSGPGGTRQDRSRHALDREFVVNARSAREFGPLLGGSTARTVRVGRRSSRRTSFRTTSSASPTSAQRHARFTPAVCAVVCPRCADRMSAVGRSRSTTSTRRLSPLRSRSTALAYAAALDSGLMLNTRSKASTCTSPSWGPASGGSSYAAEIARRVNLEVPGVHGRSAVERPLSSTNMTFNVRIRDQNPVGLRRSGSTFDRSCAQEATIL